MIMPTAAFIANRLTRKGFPSKSPHFDRLVACVNMARQGHPDSLRHSSSQPEPCNFQEFLIGVKGGSS